MDDRIHSPDRVDLICDAFGLGGAAEIADHNSCGARGELGDGRSAARRAGVQHHLMADIKKRLCRRPTGAIRAAGDKDYRRSALPIFLRTRA
jgi:hypothetical protein